MVELIIRRWCLLVPSLALAACGTTNPDLPRGQAAYDVIPAPSAARSAVDYKIGPFDLINITTFQEEDLTLKDVQVDAAGNILVPLIGTVRAGGRTSSELSREIADRLEQRYLNDPQVSVIVTSSVSQKVTVEGSVNEAGVYELKGETTLLQALAMAKGPNRTASTGQVAVFRMIDDQRKVAVFDVNAIRSGRAADPQIQGNDVIVVPFSTVKGAFRDILATVPAFGVFAVFNN